MVSFKSNIHVKLHCLYTMLIKNLIRCWKKLHFRKKENYQLTHALMNYFENISNFWPRPMTVILHPKQLFDLNKNHSCLWDILKNVISWSKSGFFREWTGSTFKISHLALEVLFKASLKYNLNGCCEKRVVKLQTKHAQNDASITYYVLQ